MDALSEQPVQVPARLGILARADAVRDGVARVVVRRETEDDLLATDVGGLE